MIHQDYFDVNEEDDYVKLITFNSKVGLFKELIQIKGNKHYDASGTTKDGRTARIELKTRNFSLGDYKTLFIEDHKTANLLFDYICLNDEPIYLNFLNDGIAVFNLRRLTKRPEIDTKRTKSGGYGCWEYGARNALYVEDAAVYDTNNILIQSPLWKTQGRDS